LRGSVTGRNLRTHMKALRIPKIRDGLAPSQLTPTNGEVSKRSIRVLILEDRVNDAELMVRELRRAGFIPEWERAETENDFLALLDQEFDIILSDYSMPRFDGLRALELLKRRGSEIPFILVSSTIGDETAVEAIKQGATDYLLKGRLARLGRSVTQALEQNRLRRERAVAEEALRESEERFRQLAENIQEVFWITDPTKNVIIYVSPAYETIWGRSRSGVYGSALSWLDAIHAEDREAVRQAALTKQVDGAYDEEYRIVRPDGSIRWICDRAFPVRNSVGEIYRIVGVARDVTERKLDEERLREQADIINRAHDAIVVRDFETKRITLWNAGAQRLYGWTAEEAIGRSIGELIFADPAEVEPFTKILISTGEFRGEVRQITKEKKELIVDSRATLVRDANGEPCAVLVINTDITEQKKLETQLLRAQRLESIGTLASGVAHDLNNILAPILMGSAVLRRSKMAPDDEAILATIETCAQRGADIVKQVLTFARGAEGERIQIQGALLLKDVAKIAEETFPKKITVRSSFSDPLWCIEGDPTQLHQVLLNLCVNARDAMPAGGTLCLSAENFPVDEHYASMTPGAQAGPHVRFEVTDTGMGIPPQNMEKIFDPFFTTKELGHGTGLGLSSVLGIVKSHGGFMNVYSEIGRGTTFNVFIPAVVDEREKVAETPNADLPRAHGELLLLVDDEKPILQVAHALLEGHGYRVLTAEDATEALALFAMRKEDIKLVLTDLAMPLMDGVSLIRTLQKMKPDVRVIPSTARGGLKQHLEELESLKVGPCLIKPYNKQKLLKTLQEVLSQEQNYS
jgi:PAS domain S-box-containing protein